MGIDFKVQNALEQAIYDKDSRKIIYAVAEGNCLTTLAPASNLGYDCFSDEVIFSVLLISATQKQLETMQNGWFSGHLKVGERLRNLITESVTPFPQSPSEAEKKLIKAIVYQENSEIIRLITEEKARFNGFAFELLTMLPDLSKAAVLTLLRDGLSAKLKAIVWGIFLRETETPEILDSLSYAERLKYSNLMMKIIANDAVSAEEPWYPENV